jgi:hypothetical protein
MTLDQQFILCIVVGGLISTIAYVFHTPVWISASCAIIAGCGISLFPCRDK